MQRTGLASLILCVLAVALSGCIRSSGEAPAFPKPLSSSTCPDLTGTFRHTADSDSQGAWSEIINSRDELGGPATAVSLFDKPGSQALTIVLHRDPAEFERAVAALRAERPAIYSEWRRRALALFDPMRGELKVSRELPFEALTRHGPVPEWGVHDWKGSCRDGWYRDTRPYDAEVWMARDVEGGLLVRFDKTERKMISLWAETGAGIPYAVHTRSRWARFAPTAAPPAWRPTAANLPPVTTSPVAGGDPAGFMQKDRDARVSTLRSRARALIGKDAMLLNFKEDGERVLFTGTMPDRAALERLIADLSIETDIANVKLESSMEMSFGRVRFALYLTLRKR